METSTTKSRGKCGALEWFRNTCVFNGSEGSRGSNDITRTKAAAEISTGGAFRKFKYTRVKQRHNDVKFIGVCVCVCPAVPAMGLVTAATSSCILSFYEDCLLNRAECPPRTKPLRNPFSAFSV